MIAPVKLGFNRFKTNNIRKLAKSKPIRIETEAGRAAYEQEQRALTEAGKPLRARLIAALQDLLGAPPG